MINMGEMEPGALIIETVIPAPGTAPRLLRSDPWRREDLQMYADSEENIDDSEEVLLGRIEKADVCGRGGAGFPLYRKITAMRSASRTQPALVINGEEGEPGSCKDRYLLRFRPHLVLDGAAIVARLIKAREVIVYVSDDLSEKSIREALEESNSLREVRVIRCEPSYTAGEESALIKFIEHGDARPMDKPPHVYTSGVSGFPTLVSNVETLAAAAIACRQPEAEQTFLCTVSNGWDKAALVEVSAGAPLSSLSQVVGVNECRYIVPGGLFGGILPYDAELPLTREDFAMAGSSLGCGAFLFLDNKQGAVSVAAEVAKKINDSIAGQCGSCVNGTRAIREALSDLASGQAKATLVEDLRRWGAGMVGRGACKLPEGATVLVNTLLRYFEGDVRSAMNGAVVGSSAVKWHVELPQPL